MKTIRVRSTLLSAAFITAAALFWQTPSALGQAPYYFTGLGGYGDLWSNEAWGATDGTNAIVAGMASYSGGEQAYRWTQAGGLVGLGFLDGGTDGNARGISANGAVIVGTSGSTAGYQAFRWTEATGMVGLGDLPGDPFRSYARGVSGDGTVVVGAGNYNPGSSTGQAFRWTQAGGMVGMGFLPNGGSFSEATGISADGLVIVGRSDPSSSTHRAFRWTQASGMVALPNLSGWDRGTIANGVSADGLTTVGTAYTTADLNMTEAVIWTEAGGIVDLGDFPEGFHASMAIGVSGDGSVVVGRGTIGDSPFGLENSRAFIWDSVNGMRDLKTVLVDQFGLDLTGWTLSNATGISPDGWNIVGYGINPSGQREAWLAHIPEPSTATLLLVGGLALLRPLRRRQR